MDDTRILNKANVLQFLPGSQLPDLGLLKKQCIAFGSHIPPPVDSINNIPGYDSDYLKKIHDKNFGVPTPVQAHLWPILFRGRSATCISAPRSGKTLAYLIPALSETQFKEEDPEKLIYGDEGPKVVIVCSSLSKAYEIREHSHNLLDGSRTTRVITITKDNEHNVSVNLLNGCEVLISTPGPLKRLTEAGFVRFDICSLLVFDDADKIFILQTEFVKSIVISYLTCYKRRMGVLNEDVNTLLTAPMLVLADSWTKEVKRFACEYMKNSINIFGDLFEAAIANKLEYEIHWTVSEDKRMEMLCDLIHNLRFRGELGRTAVVCTNDDQAKEILKALTDLDVTPTVLDSSKFNYEIPKFIDTCKNNSRAVAIITDEKIREIPQVNFIQTLVHYSLPRHSDILRTRFLLMSELIKNNHSIDTHFLLTTTNTVHAHFLCQSLRRIGEIPQRLEILKDLSNRPTCENFLAFAYCPFESTFCVNSHKFSSLEFRDKRVPSDGQIQFEIAHTVTVNQFYIRIVEYRDGQSETGNWVKYPYRYKEIKNELQTFKNGPAPDEKKPFDGKIYGLVVVGDLYRVRVSANYGQISAKETNAPINDDTPYQLEVIFIDFGYQSKALSNQLISLPKKLRDYPPLAFKSYLLGIKPVDNEIEWNHRATEKLASFLRDNQNLTATAWIRLQKNCVFWIDNLKIVQNLKHLQFKVISWNPENDLINVGLAVKNDKMFPDVNKNHHELYTKWVNHRLSKSVSQAFLPDEFEIVYVSHLESLRKIYVQRQTIFKCLDDLEKELAKSNLVPLKAFVKDGLGIGLLQTETAKSYSRIRIIKHLSSENLVRVFFVDWGETYEIEPENCFSIQEKFIKKLPFQAIECSLYGVEGSPGVEVMYDLTRSKDELMKTCLIEKVDGSKENGYSIRIWFEKDYSEDKIIFYSLSKWLVDNGHADYSVTSEADQQVTKTMNRPVDEDEVDSDDSVSKGEKKCAQALLSNVNEGMRQFLINNMKSDNIQFDPKKLSRQKKLMLSLKRLKEERERLAESDSDDESQEKEQQSVPERIINLDDVLPYDPANSSESEMESDLEENEEEFS